MPARSRFASLRTPLSFAQTPAAADASRRSVPTPLIFPRPRHSSAAASSLDPASPALPCLSPSPPARLCTRGCSTWRTHWARRSLRTARAERGTLDWHSS
eukprot:scaffold7974_cov258-Pinguiococcus_pyrenoidosus.AAC.1